MAVEFIRAAAENHTGPNSKTKRQPNGAYSIQRDDSASRKTKPGKLALIEERAAYLFLLPWLLGLVLLLGIPVVASYS